MPNEFVGLSLLTLSNSLLRLHGFIVKFIEVETEELKVLIKSS